MHADGQANSYNELNDDCCQSYSVAVDDDAIDTVFYCATFPCMVIDYSITHTSLRLESHHSELIYPGQPNHLISLFFSLLLISFFRYVLILLLWLIHTFQLLEKEFLPRIKISQRTYKKNSGISRGEKSFRYSELFAGNMAIFHEKFELQRIQKSILIPPNVFPVEYQPIHCTFEIRCYIW